VGTKTLTEQQKDILLHMTGLDRSDRQTRSHFCASQGTDDYSVLRSLVIHGLASGPVECDREIWGDSCFFYVTEAGVLAAKAAKGVDIARG
jgi:hypothetical protein